MSDRVRPLVSTLLSQNTNKLRSRFTSSTSCTSNSSNQQVNSNLLQLLPTHISKNLPPYKQNRKASVLVPLIDNGMLVENTIIEENDYEKTNVFDKLSILFTKRSSHLKEHANEISFPGGHHEPDVDNGCLIKTAIREAYEELIPSPTRNIERMKGYDNDKNSCRGSNSDDSGAAANDIRHDFNQNLIIFGQGETIPSAKLVPITPYFAYFRHQISNDKIDEVFPGNKNEVSQVFTVTISELLEVETTMSLKRLNMEGPVYPTRYGKIWGLTALILRPYLHEVLKPVFST